MAKGIINMPLILMVLGLTSLCSCQKHWACETWSYHLLAVQNTDTIDASGGISKQYYQNLIDYYKGEGYTVYIDSERAYYTGVITKYCYMKTFKDMGWDCDEIY